MGSFVAEELKSYYNKKYKDLGDKEREAAVNGAVSKTIPSFTSSISPRTRMLYGPSKGEEKDVFERIEKSGFILIYDSFAEGLEPVYFWILDFMRDTYWGPGLEVAKTLDEFEASVGGGFFGDIGTRAAIMQDRATKLIGTINTVVRSIINILYDLKEFDQRLDLYHDLDSGDKEKINVARLGLKQVWMDRVDIQRGRGSINMLAQQLQFVTLRDAFMAANSVEDVSKMDLNERVKRILAPRLEEYLTWEKLSRAELTRRYNIERTYLKSQVDSLKLYSQWAKPYLQAAQQLKMTSSGKADIVNIFNNLQIQVNLFGKKKIKFEEELAKKFKTKPEKDYYACVEVFFDFRSSPHTIRSSQTGTHYTQGGKVKISFRAFGLDEDEVKAVEEREIFEGLEYIEGITKDTLEQIQEDIEKYLKEEEEPKDPRERVKFLEKLLQETKEKNVRKKIFKKIKESEKIIIKENKSPGPFSALFGSLKDIKKLMPKTKKSDSYVASETRSAATAKAAESAYLIYLIYKKTHGMYTE